MKGDSGVINFLNQVLKGELTAINQYFLHAKMLGNWGLKSLAEKERHESIDEMKHADALIERVLFLEGLPNLQELGRLRIGETVPEVFKADLALEIEAIDLLKKAVTHSETVKDYISRELFEHILEDEEKHVDWLETQLGLIEKIGIQNFLQSGI